MPRSESSTFVETDLWIKNPNDRQSPVDDSGTFVIDRMSHCKCDVTQDGKFIFINDVYRLELLGPSGASL